MSYQMLRIFCATPGGLEDERQAFHEVIAEINETAGQPAGILFVPISITPHMANKTFSQPSVDQNVRDSSFFVLVLGYTWGPPHKNFEGEFRMASQLLAQPEADMKGVAVFLKSGQLKSSVEECPEVCEFATLDDFRRRLQVQLMTWLSL
jgi:hypothetical protein